MSEDKLRSDNENLVGEQPSESTGSARSSGATAVDAEPADLAEELAKVKAEAEDLLRRLQRSQADFINYRRRVERESEEAYIRTKAASVERILPALDDFALALKAVPLEQAESDWVQGVILIERKLRTALESVGLEKVEAVGKQFNPWEHEVVLEAEVAEVASGQVVEVLREGYKIDGKVIRPAQVKVAK